jgi:DNA-binding transcriptional regulator WhiA
MKKATKIWLITAAALILVGGMIFGGAMTMLKWDFTKLSTTRYESREYEITEPFENIRILKSSAARTRKAMNFEEANGNKSLMAAEEQKHWLQKIAESECGRKATKEDLADPGSTFWTEGLRHLPPQLKEAAYLRLYKPEASLTEIGESLTPPVGKAAISKRFAKLRALAENVNGDSSH